MNIKTADRLTELRKKKGLSQEELANELGVSRQAVSKWERAEASPDTDNLVALAKIYGVSLDELIGNPVSEKKEKEEDEVEEHEMKITKTQLRIIQISFLITLILIITAYMLLGTLCSGWHPWWMLVFVPFIVSSIFEAIFHKKPSKFNFIFLILLIYFLLSFVLIKDFSLTWIVFLLIPIYFLCIDIFQNKKR